MGSFKAGVTKVNITPPVGIHLAGFALRDQPSMGVHDELYARAIVLEDGEERVALVSADLGGLEVKSAQWIRNEAYRLTGIEPGKIIVACTHTHSGPATYFTRYIEQLDEHYVKVLERKIIGSIFWANRELKEVSIGTGSGVVKGVSHNRESGVGGATDEELGVIRVDNRKDGVECVVLNYTCHPTVLGPKNLMISADYSGAASCFVEENLARCCLFTSGACGDINPLVKLSNRDKGAFRDVARIGRIIGSEAVKVAEQMEPVSEGRVGARHKMIELPVEKPPSIEEAERETTLLREKVEALKKEGASVGKQRVAKSMAQWAEDVLKSLRDRNFPDSKRIEITLLSLNDTLLVSIPGEPFVEIGLHIKKHSPFPHTYIIGYGNGKVGYFPTAKAFKRGGYGARRAPKYLDVAFLTAECEQIVEEETIALASELHRSLEKG